MALRILKIIFNAVIFVKHLSKYQFYNRKIYVENVCVYVREKRMSMHIDVEQQKENFCLKRHDV